MDQNAGIKRCYGFKGKLEAGSYTARGSHSYEDDPTINGGKQRQYMHRSAGESRRNETGGVNLTLN